VTCYRVGMTPDGASWQVERSVDGVRPEVIATLPRRSAYALIDSIEGRLSPLRSEPDDSSRPAQSRAGTALAAKDKAAS
jgi:hypothetical protein